MTEIVNGIALFFMDVWTFAFSQLGIFALGVLFGNRLKAKADQAIDGIGGQDKAKP